MRTRQERRLFYRQGVSVLTEQEVTRSWSRLFKGEWSSDAIAKAEVLLEELRPESPLRHRLSIELDELREMSLQG
jgi:hypothetical protein